MPISWGGFGGQCRHIYHTWSVWVLFLQNMSKPISIGIQSCQMPVMCSTLRHETLSHCFWCSRTSELRFGTKTDFCRALKRTMLETCWRVPSIVGHHRRKQQLVSAGLCSSTFTWFTPIVHPPRPTAGPTGLGVVEHPRPHPSACRRFGFGPCQAEEAAPEAPEAQ